MSVLPRDPAPGRPTLLLVPTELELRRLADLGGFPDQLACVETCGFGPVAAAARTAQLVAEFAPARVVLTGLCGSYDADAHPVGSALEFDEVAIHGVGVGEGASHLAPPALGFPQWPGSPRAGAEVFDRLALQSVRGPGAPRVLVTTCAASADRAQAEQRRGRFAGALAEDMEGFAVALACSLSGTGLRIVRGVSNVVGDRDSANWRIAAALGAARERVLELLASGAGWSKP